MSYITHFISSIINNHMIFKRLKPLATYSTTPAALFRYTSPDICDRIGSSSYPLHWHDMFHHEVDESALPAYPTVHLSLLTLGSWFSKEKNLKVDMNVQRISDCDGRLLYQWQGAFTIKSGTRLTISQHPPMPGAPFMSVIDVQFNNAMLQHLHGERSCVHITTDMNDGGVMDVFIYKMMDAKAKPMTEIDVLIRRRGM